MSQKVLPIFIFGISGATWSIIAPMIKAGRLPNISYLCEQGSSGILKSIKADGDKHFRPQVAWPTIATSRSPSLHGVTRFFHTADDLRCSTVWDIYQKHGHTVGLYGWPMTWPPKPVQGFVIPSHHARDAQTWPPELSPIKALDRGQQAAERDSGKNSFGLLTGLHMLQDIYRHGLQARTVPILGEAFLKQLLCKNVEEKSLFLRHAKLEINTDFFIRLYRQYQPTCSNFTSFLVDLASHRCWHYYEPDKFSDSVPPDNEWLTKAIEHAYERIDQCLGRILAILPEKAVIAVISEHGMAEETVAAEVGPWRYVIQGNRLKDLIGLGDVLNAYPIARWFAFRAKPGKVMPDDASKRFRNIIVEETGLPLFQVYQHGEEVIVKFQIDRTIPEYQQGDLERLQIIYEDQKLSFLDVAKRLGTRRSAMHAQDGIIILKGPGIKSRFKIQGSSLLDVAPTLLKATNLPIPDNFEGQILDIWTQQLETV